MPSSLLVVVSKSDEMGRSRKKYRRHFIYDVFQRTERFLHFSSLSRREYDDDDDDGIIIIIIIIIIAFSFDDDEIDEQKEEHHHHYYHCS